MTQSRRMSLIETGTNISIGFVVSVLGTAAILPFFGYHTTWAHDFYITLFFTVTSLIRGYTVRRIFEKFKGV